MATSKSEGASWTVLESSAIAGVITRILLHPIDTCKVVIQTSSSPSTSLGAATHIIKSEGFRGLYRGFAPALAGTVPGVSLYFISYEASKSVLDRYSSMNRHLASFTAGFLAEIVSCIFWVPSDVLKERAQAGRKYSSFRSLYAQHGVRGFYRGYGATLASFGPFSAFYFMFAEQLKRTASAITGEKELPFPILLSVCAAAGGAAALCTAPLDLVKVRMQVDSGNKYPGLVSAVKHLWRTQGIPGLFRGAGSRVWFAVPNTAITMSIMESIKHRLES